MEHNNHKFSSPFVGEIVCDDTILLQMERKFIEAVQFDNYLDEIIGKQGDRCLMENIKVGVIQLKILGSKFGTKNRYENIKSVEEKITQLMEANPQTDVIVMPEEFYTGSSYNFTSIPEAFSGNKAIKKLSELAEKYNCYIIGGVTGSVDNEGKDRRYRNIGFILNRKGKIIGTQERNYIFYREAEFIVKGVEKKVFDLDIGRVGILMGIDMFYEDMIKQMVALGVEIIFAPCLLPSPLNEEINKSFIINKWKSMVLAKAYEYGIFIIGVNGVGEVSYLKGRFEGGSIIAGPFGKILELDNDEYINVIDLKSADIEKAKNYVELI